jgi:hypothetical protein
MTVLCHIPHHHVLLSNLRSITVYDGALELPKCARVVILEQQSRNPHKYIQVQEQAQAAQVSFLPGSLHR